MQTQLSRLCCGASFARNVQVMSRPWLISCPLPQKGSWAFPGTGCRSDDATSSGCATPVEKPLARPSEGSRPPAPGGVEKRILSMQGIRLDQNALEIQLSEKLLLLRRSLGLEHRPLVVLAGGVAGLAVALRLLRSRWPAPGQPNTASPGQCRRSRPEAIRRTARCQLHRRARCLADFVTRLIVTFDLAPLSC